MKISAPNDGGLINNTAGDDVLAAAEKKIESQLTPKVRKDYDRVVLAGMKVGLHNGPDGILASLKQSKDPVRDIVTGAINLVGILRTQSRGTMPIQAAIPATMTLIINALTFAREAEIIKGDTADLVQAAHLFNSMITAKLGITTQMVRTAAGNLQTLIKDPVNMEKLRRAAGVVRDPRASTATLPDQSAASG